MTARLGLMVLVALLSAGVLLFACGTSDRTRRTATEGGGGSRADHRPRPRARGPAHGARAATARATLSAETQPEFVTARDGRLVWSHQVKFGRYTLREWHAGREIDLPIPASTIRQRPHMGISPRGRLVVTYVRCSAGTCGGYSYEFATGRERPVTLPTVRRCGLRAVAVWRDVLAYRRFSYQRRPGCGDWVVWPGKPPLRVAAGDPVTSLGDIRRDRVGWVDYPTRRDGSYISRVGIRTRDGHSRVLARSSACHNDCEVTGDGPWFDRRRSYVVFDYAGSAGGTTVDVVRIERRERRTCTSRLKANVPAHDPLGDSWGDIAVDRGDLYYAAAHGVSKAPNRWSRRRCRR